MNPEVDQSIEQNFRSELHDFGLDYDPLTGLPNHLRFRNSIRQMIDRSASTGRGIALVWVDLLNLRREFSISGDEGAERLVCAVSESLRQWVEPGDLVCRFSDRCFLLALNRESDTEARLNLNLEAATNHYLRGADVRPEVAVGSAQFPEDTSSPEELIRYASLGAVSAARTRSRTVVPFHSKMNTVVQYARDLENDLRLALRQGELSLVYQPQINLTTGDVLGAECLTRWNHSTRGTVSPAQFIPIAEQSNLIQEIFTHSLRQLLSDATAWRGKGIVLPSLAVNASPANIRQENFVKIVQRELVRNPLGSTQLDIEVTESLLMDDENLFVERLEALRAIGVHVSLDDFGTRYTGFNSLKGLPLNAMKIDKCFVHGVDQSAQAQSLCGTIVTMARHLKLTTIAEGIEEPGELSALKRLGCEVGQGYLFQRPVPAEQFLQFLREWPERKKQPEFAGVFHHLELETQYQVDPFLGVI